jgi:predicted PurR-regulated permease PerM
MSRERGFADGVRRIVDELDLGWWAFALVIGAVVAFVGWIYLPWVVFGLFVYYVARPIERRLEQWVPSPNIAAAVTLLLIVVPIVALLAAAILVTITELSKFLTDDVVARIDALLPVAVGTLPQDPVELTNELLASFSGGAAQTVFDTVARTVGSVAAALYNAFLSLLFAFFLLREDERLATWFRANIADGDTDTVRYLAAVDAGLSSVYFGYTVTIFVVMVLAGIVYSAFNLIAPPGLAIPAPLPMAVITGVFTIVPLVGRSIVYLVVTAYLAIVALESNPAFLWFPLAFVLVMELPFDNLIRIYVRPALSGRLFPMGLIVFAYLIGPPLFGWYGIFFGPFLMVVVVLFVQWKLPRLLHPAQEMDGPLDPFEPGPALESEPEPNQEQTRLDEVPSGVEDEAGPTD